MRYDRLTNFAIPNLRTNSYHILGIQVLLPLFARPDMPDFASIVITTKSVS